MAHIRVVQHKGELYPRVEIAETGERIRGVARVQYTSDGEHIAEIDMTLLGLEHEVDVMFDVDVTQGGTDSTTEPPSS